MRDAHLKITWVAVEAGDLRNETLIVKEATIPGLIDTGHADISRDRPWPEGRYRVEIALNGMLKKALEFRVVAPPSGEPAVAPAPGADEVREVPPPGATAPDPAPAPAASKAPVDVRSAVMAREYKDDQPVGATLSFAPDQRAFHCALTLTGPPHQGDLVRRQCGRAAGSGAQRERSHHHRPRGPRPLPSHERSGLADRQLPG